jgi:hypothetical protein
MTQVCIEYHQYYEYGKYINLPRGGLIKLYKFQDYIAIRYGILTKSYNYRDLDSKNGTGVLGKNGYILAPLSPNY